MVIGTSSYVRPLRGAMRPPEKPKRPRRYAVSPYLHSRFTDYHAHRIMGIPYKQTKPLEGLPEVLADTNTRLVIPILARYWDEYGEMDSEKNFLSAVRAVTAFLVLRRAVTGGTARIDSDFRKVMSPSGGSGTDALCLGSINVQSDT